MTSPADPSAPWPVRRAFPLIAVVVMICIGMAGTIWGPVYYGQTTWAVPDDLWATLVAAQRFLHLDLAGLYTAPTNLVSFPGAAVILVPVAAIMDAAGIPINAGRQGVHPVGWLVAGPLETLLAAIALFAADALAQRMGVSLLKRFLLAAASATALWNVTVRWGHPEDAVAIGLLLYGVLALSNGRPDRAAWLAGAGVAVQPLALLAFPLVAIAAVEPRRLPGFVARAATPALVLLAAAAAANWTATIHAVTNQPNAPSIDHPTPWIYLAFMAPHMSGGSVAAGPARALAVLVACGCALMDQTTVADGAAGRRVAPGRPGRPAVVDRGGAGAAHGVRARDGVLLRLAAARGGAGRGVAGLDPPHPGHRHGRRAHLPRAGLVAQSVGLVDPGGRRAGPDAGGRPPRTVTGGAGAARAGGAVRRRRHAMRRSRRPKAPKDPPR